MTSDFILSDNEPHSMPSMPTQWGGDPAALGRIDHYDLLRKLGGGGFGVVYLARDTASGVEVAIKTLHSLLKHNAEEMDLLREKFRLVSHLTHTNIAKALVLHPVRDINIRDEAARAEMKLSPGDSVMVMDYAPGVTLSKWRCQFPDGIVPLDLALEVGRQVAAALDYAHGERIVHRDIKPGNIMVETLEGGGIRARILDFGLAAEIRSSMSRVSTEQGDTSGTRPYMAPEQWLGRKQDGRTDQYALACVLYELISGAPPFAGVWDTGDPMIMMATVKGESPEKIEGLAPATNAVLLRALAKDPKERFSSCAEFLESCLAQWSQKSITQRKVRKSEASSPSNPRVQAGCHASTMHPPSQEGASSAVSVAEIVRRKVRLQQAVKAIPSEVRSGKDFATFIQKAEDELDMAEEFCKLDRFAAAEERLDAAESALDELCTARKARDAKKRIQEAKECWKSVEFLGNQHGWSQGMIQDWNRLFKKVIKLLREPALQGNPEAQYLLSKYWDSFCVPPDHRKNGKSIIEAQVWHEKAVASGHPDALYEAGYRLESSAMEDGRMPLDKAYVTAAKAFRLASDQGHPRAMLHLGLLTETGLCGTADEAEASKWYEKASKDLGARAYLIVANWHAGFDFCFRSDLKDKVGIDKQYSIKCAIHWYTKAAELGENKAFLNLGDIYRHGPDAYKNLMEAEKCYRKAMELGDADVNETARRKLGELHMSPIFWFQKVSLFFRALFR